MEWGRAESISGVIVKGVQKAWILHVSENPIEDVAVKSGLVVEKSAER